MSRLLTVKQAALVLGCSEDLVRRLVNAGKLPATRIGVGPRGRIKILEEDLEAYVLGNRRGPLEPAAPKAPPVRLKHFKL
jgi:excisionase family DNA binding protein